MRLVALCVAREYRTPGRVILTLSWTTVSAALCSVPSDNAIFNPEKSRSDHPPSVPLCAVLVGAVGAQSELGWATLVSACCPLLPLATPAMQSSLPAT
jgi:hypothetical protein